MQTCLNMEVQYVMCWHFGNAIIHYVSQDPPFQPTFQALLKLQGKIQMARSPTPNPILKGFTIFFSKHP